jgi:hypothetical protein
MYLIKEAIAWVRNGPKSHEVIQIEPETIEEGRVLWYYVIGYTQLMSQTQIIWTRYCSMCKVIGFIMGNTCYHRAGTGSKIHH